MKICSVGGALPALAVDNSTLATFLDTSDQWITTRTGIHQRRVLSTETLEDLACQAALKALERTQITPQQLDYIICATANGTYVTPSMACVVQGRIGATCPAMDINAGCTGLIYALDTARAWIDGGYRQHILIIGAEAVSRFADWQDRATCILFGDAAGAVVVGPGEGVRTLQVNASSHTEFLYATTPPGNSPFVPEPQPRQPLHMSGQEVYRFAVSTGFADLQQTLAQADLKPEDIRYFLIHQANMRIIEAIRQRLGQPPEKFPTNIQRLGNTSAASIPLLMEELWEQELLRPGDLIAICAFGAGLTSGASVIQWS